MTVQSTLTPAEMREAVRLNLTPAFWWKAAFGNARAIIYLVVLVGLIVTKLKGDNSIEWTGILAVSAIVALLLILYVGRLHRAILKKAKALNASCNSITIDGQGIAVDAADGSRSFTPWSAVHQWREGKLVFTLGDAKSFRTVPKSALGEMQSGELRSVLLSQIR